MDRARDRPVDELRARLGNLRRGIRDLLARLRLGRAKEEVWWAAPMLSRHPFLSALVEEARRRDIPWVPWPVPHMIQLGHGVHQRRMRGTTTDRTGVIASDLCRRKDWAAACLRENGVPVPRGSVVVGPHELLRALGHLGFPVVLKPSTGNKGRQVSVKLESPLAALWALAKARTVSRHVVVERFHAGNDYRLLVINRRFTAAAQRTPACVIGDGHSSVRELIHALNRDPRRGRDRNILSPVRINGETRRMLRQQGVRLDDILPLGQSVELKRVANLSAGGTARDVTERVHPETVALAERVADLVGLDIMGLDLVSPDISRPLGENGGAVIEVNSNPGFRMHLSPSEGESRNLAASVLDELFPTGCPARIPVVAVTGTNGKTTTTRLAAHLLAAQGLRVGSCTTDGIYLDGTRLVKRDAAGQKGAFAVLSNPQVEAAALEVARGGLIRDGLGFQFCDVGILTNVSADHLGLRGVETLEQMASVKGAVIESVHPDGLAVVNADDALCLEQSTRAASRIAYFTLEAENPVVRAHTEGGGLAAVRNGVNLDLIDGPTVHRLGRVSDFPVTLNGKAELMVANLLAASLAAFARGVTLEAMRRALQRFEPSTRRSPGRMNLIARGRFHVLLDYAHNAAALGALAGFIRSWDGPRIGAVQMPGDRREEDFFQLGVVCAHTFERVILHDSANLRGRRAGEVPILIARGIRAVAPALPHEYAGDELDSFRRALETAPPGSLVVLLTSNVDRAIDLIENYPDEPSTA